MFFSRAHSAAKSGLAKPCLQKPSRYRHHVQQWLSETYSDGLSHPVYLEHSGRRVEYVCGDDASKYVEAVAVNALEQA